MNKSFFISFLFVFLEEFYLFVYLLFGTGFLYVITLDVLELDL